MGFFDRFRHERPFKRGQAEGARLAEQAEANWTELKKSIADSDGDPETVHALFLGAMKAFRAQQVELFRILRASESEISAHWRSVAGIFAGRYRAEVLLPLYQSISDAVPSEARLTEIIFNVDDEVARLVARIEASKDSALDRLVEGIREAEQAGRLALDPRSDAEIKESIRTEWEAR